MEALTGTVDTLENERHDTMEQCDAIEHVHQTFAEQLRQTRQDLSNREATITELREQNRTLAHQLDALIARIPAEPTT